MDAIELAENGQAQEYAIALGVGVNVQVKTPVGGEKAAHRFASGAEAFFQQRKKGSLPA